MMGLHHFPAFIMSTVDRNETSSWSRQCAEHSGSLGREAVQEVNTSSRADSKAGGRKDPGMEWQGQRGGTQKEGQKVRAERQGQLGLKCSYSSPCPVTSCFTICLPFFAFWPSGGQPSPTSQFLPTTHPPLSPTRETDLPPPCSGPRVSGSSRPGLLRVSGQSFSCRFPWYCTLCFQNLLSSHSSGRCQDVLSLDWTRSSRSRQRRAKSETPD